MNIWPFEPWKVGAKGKEGGCLIDKSIGRLKAFQALMKAIEH
jgi:hypothetical protein